MNKLPKDLEDGLGRVLECWWPLLEAIDDFNNMLTRYDLDTTLTFDFNWMQVTPKKDENTNWYVHVLDSFNRRNRD